MNTSDRPLLSRLAISVEGDKAEPWLDTNSSETPIYESLLVSKDAAANRDTFITLVRRETADDN